MELSLSHTLLLFNIFRENDGKENCAQVLEEELHRMFGTKSLYDEHDCNVVSMNSLNTHDANDMKRPKLGDAMFDENDIFKNIFAAINVCPKLGDAMFNEDDISSLPSFDMQFFYDDSMPPTYDDYIDESGFGRVSTLGTNDPLFWKTFNLIMIIMKVDLDRSCLYLVMIPLSWKRFQSIMMRTKLLLMIIIVMIHML